MDQDFARELRVGATDAERHLWYRLRGRQLGGWKFRRQVPIGDFIADFVCLEAHLIVELDGGQHNEPSKQARDAARTRWLESRGYRVLRFWNFEIFEGTDSILDAIGLALPAHPPEGKRGQTWRDLG